MKTSSRTVATYETMSPEKYQEELKKTSTDYKPFVEGSFYLFMYTGEAHGWSIDKCTVGGKGKEARFITKTLAESLRDLGEQSGDWSIGDDPSWVKEVPYREIEVTEDPEYFI